MYIHTKLFVENEQQLLWKLLHFRCIVIEYNILKTIGPCDMQGEVSLSQLRRRQTI